MQLMEGFLFLFVRLFLRWVKLYHVHEPVGRSSRNSIGDARQRIAEVVSKCSVEQLTPDKRGTIYQ